MYATQKIILAGNTLHYYQYSKPIPYGFQKPKPVRRFSEMDLEKMLEPAEFKTGNISNVYRSRKAVRLLLESNAWQWFEGSLPIRPIFITYTFAANEKSLHIANPNFTRFTQRLNWEIFNTKTAQLKWLTVPEFQKRGAVHYHTVYFNLPHKTFSPNPQFNLQLYRQVKQAWDLGFLFVEQVDNIDHLVGYVAKYFTKSNQDQRYFGKKKFFSSQNLHTPLEFRDDKMIHFMLSQCEAPDYFQKYQNEHMDTTYLCYTLPESIKNLYSSEWLGYGRGLIL